jgi:hypothetical protein
MSVPPKKDFKGPPEDVLTRSHIVMRSIGNLILDSTHAIMDAFSFSQKKPTTALLERALEREERLAKLHFNEALSHVNRLHYPLNDLDGQQRHELIGLAISECLPNTDVTNVAPKIIRDWLSLHRAFEEENKIPVSTLYQSMLTSSLELLISYHTCREEQTIKGDDLDLEFSSLTNTQKILFVDAASLNWVDHATICKMHQQQFVELLESLNVKP